MSQEEHRAKDLFRTLRPNGFKHDRSETKAYRYVGHLKAAQREVPVAITFPNLEFTRLPELTLLNPAQEALPHCCPPKRIRCIVLRTQRRSCPKSV